MKYSYLVNGVEQEVVVGPNGRVTGGRRSWGSVQDWKDELPTGTVLTADPSIVRTEEEELALIAKRRWQMWNGLASFLLLAYHLHKQ
jgi:hypothetical protein